jgi:hypothetical protein
MYPVKMMTVVGVRGRESIASVLANVYVNSAAVDDELVEVRAFRVVGF